MKNAFDMEDCIKNRESEDQAFHSEYKKPFDDTYVSASIKEKLYWYWKVKIAPIFYRVVAVVMGMLSITIIFSELLLWKSEFYGYSITLFFDEILRGTYYKTMVQSIL